MDYILKLTAVCIVCAVMTLTIKKQNPEIAILLGIAGAIGCIWCSTELFAVLSEEFKTWQTHMCLSEMMLTPLLKCLGIAVVSQLGIGVCKDAGQSAVASALELCANVASAWCLLPLFNHLFAIIEDML